MTLNTLLLTFTAFTGGSDSPSLGDYFGFTTVDSIKIGNQAGPMYEADINGDGLMDLLVINNHKSRIDLLIQKQNASPDDNNMIPKSITKSY